MPDTSHWRLLIDTDAIDKAYIDRHVDAPAVHDGEVSVTLTRCGMSANNVTYAVLGNGFGPGIDMPGYWTVFPSGVPGRGLLPVWGFAEVTQSRCHGIDEGEVLYGYFPLAGATTFEPSRVSAAGFTDGQAHRRAVAGVYNQYLRLAALPALSAQQRDLWPVFRPLLMTGFMIADQFEQARHYGASQLIIASASSKTAMMTAHCLRQLADRPRLIGLTSAGNAAFVSSTGLYDAVVEYDALSTLEFRDTSAFIDMAGNRELVRAVHTHFGETLTFSLMVGMSHWQSAAGEGPQDGPRITVFFAPGRIQQRVADWGAQGLNERTEAAWQSFVRIAPELTSIVHHNGPDQALACYRNAVAGRIDPRQSKVLDFAKGGDDAH